MQYIGIELEPFSPPHAEESRNAQRQSQLFEPEAVTAPIMKQEALI